MKKLLYFSYLAGIVLVACYSYKKPDYNFDMLPYIALVVKMDNKDIRSVHRITYQSVWEKVPPGTYRRLTDSVNPFRRKMSEDPLFFSSQLPFYMIKPFYTGLIYLFYKTGLSLPHATVMPSILAYLLTGLLLLHWLENYLSLSSAVVTSLFTLFSAPFLGAARMSTPDLLSGLFLFSAFYFILEKPKTLPLFLLLALSVFTRVDNIIGSICLLTLFAFTSGKEKISLWQYLSLLILLVLCYFSITISTRSFGWSPLFYPSFRASDPHFRNGLSTLIEGLYYSHSLLLLFVLVLLLLSYPPFRSDQFRSDHFRSDRSFILVILGIIVIRLMLYPDPADRYFLAYYLAALILIVRRWQLKGVLSETLPITSPPKS
ncbi:hypothetical protein ACX0G9_00665 [Flavitalea flava]